MEPDPQNPLSQNITNRARLGHESARNRARIRQKSRTRSGTNRGRGPKKKMEPDPQNPLCQTIYIIEAPPILGVAIDLREPRTIVLAGKKWSPTPKTHYPRISRIGHDSGTNPPEIGHESARNPGRDRAQIGDEAPKKKWSPTPKTHYARQYIL